MLVLACPLFAAEKMQVAVLDLQPRGVSKIVTGSASDIIPSDVVKTGLLTVMEPAQITENLKQWGSQMTGCTDKTHTG